MKKFAYILTIPLRLTLTLILLVVSIPVGIVMIIDDISLKGVGRIMDAFISIWETT